MFAINFYVVGYAVAQLVPFIFVNLPQDTDYMNICSQNGEICTNSTGKTIWYGSSHSDGTFDLFSENTKTVSELDDFPCTQDHFEEIIVSDRLKKCWMIEYTDLPYTVTHKFNIIQGSENIKREYNFTEPD